LYIYMPVFNLCKYLGMSLAGFTL